MKAKHNFIAKTEAVQTFEQAFIVGEVRLTLVGHRCILLENFKGITEYNQKTIVLQSKHEKVQIEGERLYIPYYAKDEMMIEGCIRTIAIKDLYA